MEAITGMFSAIPLDWMILSGILIVVALDSLRSGVGRALALSVALVLALALFSLVGQTVVLGSSGLLESTLAQAILFGALVVALFFIARRMGLDYAPGGMGEPIQALLAGAATAVILVCVWLQVPVLTEWWAPNSMLQSIFAESYRLPWLLASLGVLAFTRG